MTDTPRQPPEPICVHFDWLLWEKQPCRAGVRATDVTYGPVGSMCRTTLPCAGFCDKATCAKRVLPDVPATTDEQQGRLF